MPAEVAPADIEIQKSKASASVWNLIRKELLGHMLTLRLVVALVFTLVLCVLTTLLGSVNYSDNVRAYDKAVDDLRQQMADTRVFRQLEPDVIVPPQPVQILCRGGVQARASGSPSRSRSTPPPPGG